MYGSFIHCRDKNQHFLIFGPSPPFWQIIWTLSFFHVYHYNTLPTSPRPHFNSNYFSNYRIISKNRASGPTVHSGPSVEIWPNPAVSKTLIFYIFLKFTCILTQFSKNCQVSINFDPFFDILNCHKCIKIFDFQIFHKNLATVYFDLHKMA